ncbi:MAG: hypothetical protein AAB669_02455 [Patescibacteria group bacterium]
MRRGVKLGLGLLAVGVGMIATSLLFPQPTTSSWAVRLFACGIVAAFVGVATSVHYWLEDEPTDKAPK